MLREDGPHGDGVGHVPRGGSGGRANGQADREKKAARAADTLEPNLPKLTVTVPDAAADKGVEVKRNGTPVPKSLWEVWNLSIRVNTSSKRMPRGKNHGPRA